MGIKSLFGFGQARDKPVDKAADAGYSFLFGRTTSGKPVNERTAMQTTAVYACVRILAEAVASLPLHVYEYQDDGGKKLMHDHPLYYLLHDEPNPEMTSFVFRETLMSHLLILGNAYAQIVRKVLSLYPLLPNKMSEERDSNGVLYYVYSRYSDEPPNMKKMGDITLRQEDVLHIPGLGFDGLIDYSPIAMAGTKVLMSPVAMMMIHNPATIAIADTAEMKKAIEMLDEVKESIMNAYEIKTGLNRTKISHLMDAESWFNAKKAVELGFADEILFDKKNSY